MDSPVNIKHPLDELENILLCSIELLSLDENDYSWSSWGNKDAAIQEIENLLIKIKNRTIPDNIDVSILFVVTGPIQEVSLSSGWGYAFLEIADRFDQIEKLIWKN